MTGSDTNPFSTRFIRPDVCEYAFSPQESLKDILSRLDAAGGRGQIVGPHGCGKSTLMNALKRHFESQGIAVRHVMLTSSSAKLPKQFTSPINALDHSDGAGSLLLLDGYEQLNWWQRMRLRWRCRHLKCGLIVTCHRDLGLPTIAALTPDIERLRLVVSQLISAASGRPSEDELEQIYQVSKCDIRECIFQLYDWYERRAGT
jgi:GTPase SAR1 family protein